jgi:hypothetical protein
MSLVEDIYTLATVSNCSDLIIIISTVDRSKSVPVATHYILILTWLAVSHWQATRHRSPQLNRSQVSTARASHEYHQ